MGTDSRDRQRRELAEQRCQTRHRLGGLYQHKDLREEPLLTERRT